MTSFNVTRAEFPNEFLVAMTGSTVLIGTLVATSLVTIFDNQSTTPVAISINDPTGSRVWKTFSAGEALVLDQNQFPASKGMNIYGNGAASGNFSLATVSAHNT